MAVAERSAALGWVAGFLLMISGCTRPEPTTFSEIPPVPTGHARIWFYRDYEPYAGRGQPAVAANGSYVGIAELAAQAEVAKLAFYGGN
jgi:hypothetical protein